MNRSNRIEIDRIEIESKWIEIEIDRIEIDRIESSERDTRLQKRKRDTKVTIRYRKYQKLIKQQLKLDKHDMKTHRNLGFRMNS